MYRIGEFCFVVYFCLGDLLWMGNRPFFFPFQELARLQVCQMLDSIEAGIEVGHSALQTASWRENSNALAGLTSPSYNYLFVLVFSVFVLSMK